MHPSSLRLPLCFAGCRGFDVFCDFICMLEWGTHYAGTIQSSDYDRTLRLKFKNSLIHYYGYAQFVHIDQESLGWCPQQSEKGRQRSVGSTWDADGNKNTPINPNQNYIINLQVWWLQAWLLNLPRISHLPSGIFQGEMKDQRLPDKASKVPRTFILGYAGGANNKPSKLKMSSAGCFQCLLFCLISRVFPANFLCPNFWVSQGFKFLNGSSDAIEWQAERLQGSGYLMSDDSPGKRWLFFPTICWRSPCDIEMSNNVMICNVFIYIYVCH